MDRMIKMKNKQKKYTSGFNVLKTLKVVFIFIAVFSLMAAIFSCNSNRETPGSMEEIIVVLDWVPNTNHTGIYVAAEKGFYEKEGLKITVVQPTEGGAADLIAANKGQFGISYQEQVTYARTSENPLPIKAIAAIIGSNTSGFASPKDKNIITPADFENKIYGGWGSPIEEAMLKALMEKYNSDFEKLEIVNIGASDFITSVQKDVDFSWIFFGWDGIAAQTRGLDINFMLLQDLDENLDFYTPVIIASEDFIKANPGIISSFLAATSKGYEFAIENPVEAANILLKSAPELDEEIVLNSQKYLSGYYKKGSGKWGFMEEKIWETFSNWMFENNLTQEMLDHKNAFTNEYLPK